MAELEHEAYAFASELLMPKAALMQELTTPVTLATLAPLKLRWRVSLQALIRRARDLAIVSERQYYYLSEQIARSGLRTAEPPNLAVPIERPRALRQLAELLYGRPIDLRRLAIDANLTPQFLGDVLNAHAEAASPASKSTRRQFTVLKAVEP
jgi:Zn-dependent peptidase ImmA (M78 family)